MYLLVADYVVGGSDDWS